MFVTSTVWCFLTACKVVHALVSWRNFFFYLRRDISQWRWLLKEKGICFCVLRQRFEKFFTEHTWFLRSQMELLFSLRILVLELILGREAWLFHQQTLTILLWCFCRGSWVVSRGSRNERVGWKKSSLFDEQDSLTGEWQHEMHCFVISVAKTQNQWFVQTLFVVKNVFLVLHGKSFVTRTSRHDPLVLFLEFFSIFLFLWPLYHWTVHVFCSLLCNDNVSSHKFVNDQSTKRVEASISCRLINACNSICPNFTHTAGYKKQCLTKLICRYYSHDECEELSHYWRRF